VGFGKFAPITAQLLARKGEAAPSVVGSAFPVDFRFVEGPMDAAMEEPAMGMGADRSSQLQENYEPRFVYTPERAARPKPAPARAEGGPSEKPRRIVLNLTPQEYETLGLVAVKKGVTRHQLAQSAIDAYFDWLVEEYNSCGCIVGGATERCTCRER
jgi:hypothetical protein